MKLMVAASSVSRVSRYGGEELAELRGSTAAVRLGACSQDSTRAEQSARFTASVFEAPPNRVDPDPAASPRRPRQWA